VSSTDPGGWCRLRGGFFSKLSRFAACSIPECGGYDPKTSFRPRRIRLARFAGSPVHPVAIGLAKPVVITRIVFSSSTTQLVFVSMSARPANPRLRGIVPPMITPLRDRDELDTAGLERLVEHILRGGVHGLFILGTTGEAPSLSYHVRRDLIDRTCELVDGRVPVLVGITDTSFVESVGVANRARAAGADAVVLATPYYFPAGQTELIGYVQRLCDELPLPVILYNMPSLTKVWFEIETLQTLASIETIIGVKDSSGDLDYFAKLISLKQIRHDWSVMIGPEAMLGDSLALGGDGGVSGGANILPRLFVDRFNQFHSGDDQAAQETQAKIMRLQQIYDIGKYPSRFIKATNCAASLLGICDDFMAEPFNRFHPPDRQRVAEILRDAFPELAESLR
jgi:4-hydroxy-tetrahydrodipicolinate synthase